MREQEVRELYEAYLQVHRVQEEVEVVDEAREANRDPEGYEERQRTSQSSRQRRMNDPHTGINSPAFNAFMAQQMGGKKKKKVDEETDLFDTILEYLVTEGYADTNESALVIMANMSEEWRQSIVEEVLDEELTGERAERAKEIMKSARPHGRRRASTDARFNAARRVLNSREGSLPDGRQPSRNISPDEQLPTKRGGSGIRGRAKTYTAGGGDGGQGNRTRRRAGGDVEDTRDED